MTLLRAADAFFTAVLLIMALLGMVLVWATGQLDVLTGALLIVALIAPSAYRRRQPA